MFHTFWINIYMISNTQTLKIKISAVRYPNFVMKIFSEGSNDSLFDDVFIRFFGCIFTTIFVIEVYKFTFKTYQIEIWLNQNFEFSVFHWFYHQHFKDWNLCKDSRVFHNENIFSESANVSLSDDITCQSQLLIESAQRSRKGARFQENFILKK